MKPSKYCINTELKFIDWLTSKIIMLLLKVKKCIKFIKQKFIYSLIAKLMKNKKIDKIKTQSKKHAKHHAKNCKKKNAPCR